MCQRPELIAATPGSTPDRHGSRGEQTERLTPAERSGRAHRPGTRRQCMPPTAPGPTATGASRIPGFGKPDRAARDRRARRASRRRRRDPPRESPRSVANCGRRAGRRAPAGTARSPGLRTVHCPTRSGPGERHRDRCCRPSRQADPAATGGGTPAMRSQPLRPNNDEAHGRLAMNPSAAAPTATDTMSSAERHEPHRAPSVLSASTTPIATTRNANDGTKAKRDGREQRQLAQHPQPAARRNGRVPVARCMLVGRRRTTRCPHCDGADGRPTEPPRSRPARPIGRSDSSCDGSGTAA